MADSVSSETSSSLLDSVIPILFRIGAVVVGLVAVFGGLLYAKQESILYLPEVGGIPRSPKQNPRGYRSPDERNIPYENHMITCEDGVHIHAWFLMNTVDGVRVKPGSPTIIMFHGNAGNIGLRIPNAMQMMQNLNANILMVEYRGYGDSHDVSPTEAGLRKDAEAALQFCQNHPQIDADRVFVFGRSLGGAVAFHLADYAERKSIPLAGVIVENTFLSISHMVDHLMPFLTPLKPLVLKMKWNSYEIVPHLQTPILYLAGAQDQLVPHQHMLDLFGKSSASRMLQIYVVPDGTHNETWVQGGPKYWQAFAAFLSKVLSLEMPPSSPGVVRKEFGVDAGGTMEIPTMSSKLTGMAKEAFKTKKKD